MLPRKDNYLPTQPQEYFQRHSALSDWLRPAASDRREAILAEDLTRADRLAVLNSVIGLPIVDATRFSGTEVIEQFARFAEFERSAIGPYAVKAVLQADDGIVVRNRNLPIQDLIAWLHTQVGDIADYTLEFSPHVPNEWSTIFVVTSGGVLGEVVRGSLRQLTQGGGATAQAASYTYDFTTWTSPSRDPRSREIAENSLSYIKVESTEKRDTLTDLLGISFANDEYIMGYFEGICGPDGKFHFIDFNMALAQPIDDSYWSSIRLQQQSAPTQIHGLTASRGVVRGRARVILHHDSLDTEFQQGDILVCVEPVPTMVPLLATAGGLVNDRGGILSHASIVCRELKVPCIVGTHNATELIRNGAMIELDATAGLVTIEP